MSCFGQLDDGGCGVIPHRVNSLEIMPHGSGGAVCVCQAPIVPQETSNSSKVQTWQFSRELHIHPPSSSRSRVPPRVWNGGVLAPSRQRRRELGPLHFRGRDFDARGSCAATEERLERRHGGQPGCWQAAIRLMMLRIRVPFTSELLQNSCTDLAVALRCSSQCEHFPTHFGGRELRHCALFLDVEEARLAQEQFMSLGSRELTAQDICLLPQDRRKL
mmetsp:Transcript_70203/g.165172  ORF Transcript_70203/g.165172 Transcript_70203/m.165172 type:complete len:218 (+) Transcript_70203:1443-2096(+)